MTAAGALIRIARNGRGAGRALLALLVVFTLGAAVSPTGEADTTGQSAGEQGDNAEGEPAPTGLTPAEETSLRRAVQRGDNVALRAIVTAAIARSPARASLIIKEAVRIAPSHAPSIVDAVASTFPELRDRAEAAARAQLDREASPTNIKHSDGEASGRRQAPEDAWSGKTSLGGSYRSSNIRSVGVTFQAEVAHDSGVWRNTGKVSFDYDRSKGETNTQRLRVRARTQRALSDRLYAFALLDYRNDRFSGFDHQWIESIGSGYRIVDTDRATWDLEVGPSLRQSRITASGEIVNDFFLRAGSRIKWLFSDTAELTNETAVLYNGDTVEVEAAAAAEFEGSDEVSNVTALHLAIIGNLAARLSTEFSYTSDPPPGGTKTETLSKIALVHSF
ncbi:MAG TPA: DUF481 domain-containing protein [Arenicellales bacterium]|nr:DUF481 domain-containing protein [Arenicellales bacterium]